MLWRIITESREGYRPGITADAAHNKVATGPILKQYKLRTLKTWVLAANENSVFKFEKDAEEEETRDLTPRPLNHQDVFFLLLRPPGIAKRVLNIPCIASVWVLGPVVGSNDRGYKLGSNYFDPEEVDHFAGTREAIHTKNPLFAEGRTLAVEEF
jgi:hypothetical protein